MKKKLCLFAALSLSLLSLAGCKQVEARIAIREGNDAYQKQDYAAAVTKYSQARRIDPQSFPELDRLIGYSRIGMYVPDDKSPANEQIANEGIAELRKYLKKRPDDHIARESLVNLYLNANRTTEAINFFKEHLATNPKDVDAARSVATLYAKQGEFNEALMWYEKIIQLDPSNPEGYYIFGVVCYEKVAKSPPPDVNERIQIIERGKTALQKSIQLKPDYAESMAYLNLLLRQQAILETDPAKQQALIVQADAVRSQAMAIIARQKSALPPAAAAPAPPPAGQKS